MAPSTRRTRHTIANENSDTNPTQNAVSSPAAKRRKTPRKSNAKVDWLTIPSQPQRSGPILDSSKPNQEEASNPESNGHEFSLRGMMIETVRGGKVSQARSTYDDPLQGQMKIPIRASSVVAPSSLPQKTSHVSNNEVVSPKTIPPIPIPSRSVSPFSILKPQIWAFERRRASCSSQESFGSPPSLLDDKLPKDIEECVRWLTEWADEHGMEGTLSTDIGPEFASHFASFYPDGIEEKELHTPANVGYDLKSSFTGMVTRGSRRIYSRAVRKWIEEPEQEARKAETEKLVDEKLKEITTHEEEINMGWDFDQKVGYLAGRQNRKRLFENTWGLDGMPLQHFDIFNPMDNKKKNCDFQVHLRYLIGGYGNISRVDTIYFDYVTPFYVFLKDLQDQTTGCTIPPRDSLNPQIIVHSIPPKKEAKAIRDTEGSVMQGYDPNELSDKQIPDPLTTTYNGLTPNPGGLVEKFKPAAARGYTLKHGPWVYWRGLLSKCDEHVPKQDNQWLKIENEDDYKSMVHDLYEANKSNIQAAKAKLGAQTNGYSQHPIDEDPENTYVLFIMHSLDYQEYLNAQKRKEIDEKEDVEWCEQFRNIPKGHDINPGQSWSAYMEEYYEKHPTDPLKFLDEYERTAHGL